LEIHEEDENVSHRGVINGQKASEPGGQSDEPDGSLDDRSTTSDDDIKKETHVGRSFSRK